MKKREHVKTFIICILVLYFVSVSAVFGMSKLMVWCMLNTEKGQVADIYEQKAQECEVKISKGEMAVEEALVFICKPETTLVNCMPFAAVRTPYVDGETTVIAAQGEIRDDFTDKSAMEIFREYYEKDEILRMKKDFKNLDPFDDVEMGDVYITLDGREYGVFYAIAINQDYIAATNSDFLEKLICVSVAYIVVGAVLYGMLPRRKISE